MSTLILPKGTFFLCDTYVNQDPTAQQIAEMTVLAADEVRRFGITPKVALLSHSSFGSSDAPSAAKMREALQLIQDRDPSLEVDGEIHGDAALSEDIRRRIMPNAHLKGQANILILPTLDAANIAFNLLKIMGDGVSVGPILLGTTSPLHPHALGHGAWHHQHDRPGRRGSRHDDAGHRAARHQRQLTPKPRMVEEQHPLGVMVSNLGTPDAPTAPALRRYLAEFLWDPRVVEAPRPLWWLALHGVILRVRPRRSAAASRRVSEADGSPLLSIALRQREALAATLADRLSRPVRVALGMRYGRPALGRALTELTEAGCEKVLVLPLYPQYSGPPAAPPSTPWPPG